MTQLIEEMMVHTSGDEEEDKEDEEGRVRGADVVGVDESKAVGERGSAVADAGWGGDVVVA
jgi:hypothetical protein